jgi:glycine cleavage system aminomethyltransferase T
MGYVKAEYAKAGTVITVQIRKRQAKAEIIKGRFLS